MSDVSLVIKYNVEITVKDTIAHTVLPVNIRLLFHEGKTCLCHFVLPRPHYTAPRRVAIHTVFDTHGI